jgi:hypothetical protein
MTESAASKLSQSVEGLRSAVNDLVTRLGSAAGEVQNFLAKLQEVTAQRDAALAGDATDDAIIADLTSQRDQLLADALANAQSVREVTDQIKALAPPIPQVGEKRRWLHVLGLTLIGLIAVVAIVLAARGFNACSPNLEVSVGECRGLHVQHLLAVLGTVTAALASFRQGRKAKKKSDYHKGKKADADHNNDFVHFKKVSFWWYVFFVGALVAVGAELIDWWLKPFSHWLTQVIHWLTQVIH